MKTLHISVLDKIATYLKRDGDIVCGNSDYQIEFTFDSEWNDYQSKTARFIINGKYVDVAFLGTVCPVPVIINADTLQVGVYAGDLTTTTSATIPCRKSILCEGSPEEGFPLEVNTKGDSVFVRYSANADGTDFTEEWSEGQTYIGQATAQNAPTDKTAYKWSKFIDDSVDAALDRILEIQQALIGYIVDLYNGANGIGGESGCYVSTTKPTGADDYDVHLPAMNTTGTPLYFNETIGRIKKLYVWTDTPGYYVSAHKRVNSEDWEHIGDYEEATSWDKACEITVSGPSVLPGYAFYGTR